jgi:chromosome segregation ATPase
MTRFATNGLIVLVLCCLPALTGCVDQEKKKALADLETSEAALAGANLDLAAARAALDTAQKERDSLQKELQDLKGQNQRLRAQMDKLAANLEASELQREQLTKQSASAREAAAKESAGLKTRMAALEKDLADRVAQIESLQEQIAQLHKKLDAALQPPAPPKPAP